MLSLCVATVFKQELYVLLDTFTVHVCTVKFLLNDFSRIDIRRIRWFVCGTQLFYSSTSVWFDSACGIA